MLISIIHPSRKRYELAKKLCADILSKCSGKHQIQYILSIDEDDKSGYINAFDSYFLSLFPEVTIQVNDNKTHVEAVNSGALKANGDMIIVVGDDFIFPPSFDELLVDCVNPEHGKEWVISINDGLQPRIITLPILSKEYYKKQGCVYYPEYQAMFADNDFTERAFILNKVILAKHLLFKHNHHSIGGIKKDEISTKQESSWNQGEKLFAKRKLINFGVENA